MPMSITRAYLFKSVYSQVAWIAEWMDGIKSLGNLSVICLISGLFPVYVMMNLWCLTHEDVQCGKRQQEIFARIV